MMSCVCEALVTVNNSSVSEREREMEKGATGSNSWFENMILEDLRIIASLMGGTVCSVTPLQNSDV
jgi:hypothetical protein